MKRIRCSYFFSLVISFALLISPLPLVAMVENVFTITSIDKAIVQNSDEQYIYLGEEASDIIPVVHELSNFDKNEESPLHCLKRHIQHGYAVAQRDDVIEALMYAEKYLGYLDYADDAEYAHVQKIESNLEKVIDLIAQGCLTIDSKLLQAQDIQKEAKRSFTNIMQVKGLLSVNDQLVQNITAVDLSVTDAIIDNLTVNNPVVFLDITTLSVVDESVSGTLSVNDVVVNDYLRFKDNAGGEYVGLQAPAVIPTSYTVSLPSIAPTANQVLRANTSTPTNLEWFTSGGSVSPSSSGTIYVAKYGNDSTGDGSFDSPYLTLAKAIDIANSIASLSTPITIMISSGIYVEDNSSGALSINVEGVSITGESTTGVIISPNTPANTLLLVNYTTRVANVTFQSSSALGTGISLAAGTLTVFVNVRFVGFLIGVNCAGGATQTYGFNNCLFVSNGTAINVNDAVLECNSCTVFGRATIGSAVNTGLSVTGGNASVIVNGGVYGECETAVRITNDAQVSLSGINFRRNSFDIVQDGASHLTLSSCTFELTDSSSDIDLQVSGAGTVAEVSGCEFAGLDPSNVAQGIGIQITDSAIVNMSGGIMHDYDTAIQLGGPTDTSTTVLTAGSLIIRNCTTDILQQGTTTLQFNACTASSSKISIDDPTNVELAFFDLDDNGALTIGSTANQDTTLIQAAIDPTDHPDINYKSSLYSTQAIGFDNEFGHPSSLFMLSANQDAYLTGITTDRTKIAGLRLVSDTASPVGGTTALRGWDINKNASTAELAFKYQNSDIVGQSSIPQYTLMQLDGVNNQLQLPTAATQIVFSSDTTLYRNSANVLKTDDNFIVGALTSSRAVITDGSNQLASSSTTSTEVGYLSGVTSSVQTQLNGKVSKSGDTMTGTLQLPAGTTALPSLVFTGSTTTGLSANSDILSFSNAGVESMKINSSGIVSIDGFTSAGVVHNDASGNLSSSLIVNNDITNATISNAKLATISSSNVPGAIVVRDGSGNFATNMITLTGTVTNNTDAATKAYVDTVAATGIVAKTPAVVVSTTDIGSPPTGLLTIDGVTLVANDRVLLVGQTDPVENGLWLAQSGAWTRPTDFDTGDLAGQAYVLILSGDVYKGSSWLCNTPTAIIGTDPINFSLFSLPDVTTGANIGSGTGLVFANKTGITLNFRSLLAGSHVSVTTNASDITIATDATSSNTPSTIVARDASGNFSAGTITANLTGSASNNVLKAGDTMTGSLSLPAGTTANPSLNFTGSTTTGLSASSDILSFSNAGVESMKIDSSGIVSIDGFTSAGVVHNDASGNLSTSLIVNADVSATAAIVDTKLATISTAGKVANSATTATSANTANTIVLRDSSGNFNAGTIVANLTGSASNNVLKAGDTMTGTLQLPAGTTALPSLVFTGSTTSGLSADSGDLLFSTNAIERMRIENGGAIVVDAFTVPGVVHNAATGELSSSLIVNADVAAGAAIIDTKLATISTAGKVANSATTATSANIASTIVARDASGNFSAGAVSFTDAVIQNLTITNCIADICVTALSVVDLAVSATLSVADEVVDSSLTITPFTTAGVVHNDSNGLLSSSLIVNADVDPAAAIVDTKLATISTAGKVANSATTATSANTANTIVLRNASGNFSAGQISVTDEFISNSLTIIPFSTAGVLHNNAVGAVSSSLIVNADVSPTAAIVDTKLATISTAGKVANSATTATSANTANAIVARDASGNFSAGAVSFTDAVVQNLTVTNCIADVCATTLSVVDLAVSATLSVADEVVDSSLTITPFSTAGVVHNDASGLLSSSLIVNADVSASAAIVDTKLATISTAGKVANSATTATSANTASAIVARDASGNFSAGTITANLSGNATTATTSTNFTGSLSGDVTGTQSATVVSFVGGQTAANVAAATVLANAATSANTASTIVKRTATGGFSAGTVSVTDSVISSTATITPFSTAGVVHNDASGLLSSSLIVNADVSASAAIVDTKLATISTAGKVANSATTGTNLNNANTLVLRDSTGSFAAQIVSVVDTVASGNLVLSTNPSTSTAGNILKGGNRFIHNYGTSNTFVGVNAGNFTMTGTGQNTALGVSALTANTTGNNNTALGYGTLIANTTGANNIAIGYQAGQTITTGSGNIYINADAAAVSENSTIRIGTSQTQCFIAGITGTGVSGDGVTVDSNGQLGITLSSQVFKRNIQNMNELSENIFQLRPVTFIYKNDEENTTQYGLIAEEVEKVFPSLVSKDENGAPYTVRYHLLPVLLLNEIQRQQRCIDEMKQQYVTKEEMGNAINSLRLEMMKYMIDTPSVAANIAL